MGLSAPGTIAVFLLFGATCVYNIIAVGKQGRLLEYFHKHHPDKIERMRRKRVLGVFYLKGSGNMYRFACNHEPLGDVEAERLLADYARFVKLSTLIMVGAFALMAPIILCSVSGGFQIVP